MNTVKEINGKVEEKIGLGSLWRFMDSKEYWMIARVNDAKGITLISLKNGLMWGEYVDVEFINDINEREWTNIVGDSVADKFTRVHAIEIRSDDGKEG